VRTVHLAPRLAQLSDSQLENAIRIAHRALINAKEHRSKAAAWRVMSELIKGRSPQAVARMEQERGLAKPS
jgi:hypothetical protein